MQKPTAEAVRHVTAAVNAEIEPLLNAMGRDDFTLTYVIEVSSMGIRSVKASPTIPRLYTESQADSTERIDRILAAQPEPITAIVMLVALLQDMAGDMVLTRCNEIAAPAVD
jgi:hypothetical protein